MSRPLRVAVAALGLATACSVGVVTSAAADPSSQTVLLCGASQQGCAVAGLSAIREGTIVPVTVIGNPGVRVEVQVYRADIDGGSLIGLDPISEPVEVITNANGRHRRSPWRASPGWLPDSPAHSCWDTAPRPGRPCLCSRGPRTSSPATTRPSAPASTRATSTRSPPSWAATICTGAPGGVTFWPEDPAATAGPATAEGAVPPAWALGLLIASLVLLELCLTVRDARRLWKDLR